MLDNSIVKDYIGYYILSSKLTSDIYWRVAVSRR